MLTDTNIHLPRVISGTSLLGNLYEELPFARKKELIKTFIDATNGVAVFDTAGKYGARLALETIGNCLRDLDIKQDDVIIRKDDNRKPQLEISTTIALG